MNTNLIFVLHRWDSCMHDENIDIDWPAIHKLVGLENIDWILNQPKTSCQLVVEKINEEYRLILEFYNTHAARSYQALMS